MSPTDMPTEAQREESLLNYGRCVHLFEFVDKAVLPVLESGPPRSTSYENAIVISFYRSHYVMHSLTKLDALTDFQAVRSLTRSLFEIYLDIRTLSADHSLCEKYHAYTALGRMRAAIEIADFVRDNPSQEREERYELQIKLARDSAKIAECEEWLRTLYGRTVDLAKKGKMAIPHNWTDSNNLERVKSLPPAFLEFYSTEYAQACWYVHGGGVGFGGISAAGIVHIWSYGLQIAKGLFQNVVLECCLELNLVTAIPGLLKGLRDCDAVDRY
jgi:hypothetical protein